MINFTMQPARSCSRRFTDPAALVQWFWPQRFGTRFDRDLRPGGAFGIHADGLPDDMNLGVAENLTKVVVTHSANPSPAARDDHLQGWRDCLGRLVETFATAAS